MFGFEYNEGPPPRHMSLTVFTTAGLAHGLLMNLLQRRRLLFKPWMIAYRMTGGLLLGHLIDHWVPGYWKVYRADADYKRQMQLWEEGVKQRRARELEIKAAMTNNNNNF